MCSPEKKARSTYKKSVIRWRKAVIHKLKREASIRREQKGEKGLDHYLGESHDGEFVGVKVSACFLGRKGEGSGETEFVDTDRHRSTKISGGVSAIVRVRGIWGRSLQEMGSGRNQRGRKGRRSC